jgi:hypothetical protein
MLGVMNLSCYKCHTNPCVCDYLAQLQGIGQMQMNNQLNRMQLYDTSSRSIAVSSGSLGQVVSNEPSINQLLLLLE